MTMSINGKKIKFKFKPILFYTAMYTMLGLHIYHDNTGNTAKAVQYFLYFISFSISAKKASSNENRRR